MPQITEVDKEKFEQELQKVRRIWDPKLLVGHAQNGASEELKESCTYIFIRDDGWSVASPTYPDAHSLWRGSWKTIYQLNQEI